MIRLCCEDGKGCAVQDDLVLVYQCSEPLAYIREKMMLEKHCKIIGRASDSKSSYASSILSWGFSKAATEYRV